ncbi:MAG: hypothetical protein ACXWC8_02560 [Limisphaerales bacterium]
MKILLTAPRASVRFNFDLSEPIAASQSRQRHCNISSLQNRAVCFPPDTNKYHQFSPIHPNSTFFN